MADRFPKLSETDLTSLVDQKNSENINGKQQRSNDKTIIELGDRKIS